MRDPITCITGTTMITIILTAMLMATAMAHTTIITITAMAITPTITTMIMFITMGMTKRAITTHTATPGCSIAAPIRPGSGSRA